MTTTKDAPNLQLDFVEIVAPRLWMTTTEVTTWVDSSPTSTFSVDNPTASWYDLGTIKSARIPVTKDVFQKEEGIPRTTRKMWEIGRTAQLTFNTQDLSPYVEALMNGQTIFNTMATTPGAEGSHVASLYTDGKRRRKYALLASTPGSMSQFDLVACASPANASIESRFNLAMVDSISASKLTLRDVGFPADPVAGDVIRKVDKVEFIDSLGSDVARSALLFWDGLVTNDTSRYQYAMYFPKVKNFSGAEIDFKDNAEPYDQSITLVAIATLMTFTDGSTGYNFYKKFMLQY